MPQDRHTGEFTLLCERCGYVIEGLPGDGACPECGKPIAESLPEARAGSPWQGLASHRRWLDTATQLTLHPRTGFGRVRIDRGSCSELLLRNLLTASLVMAIAFGVIMLRMTIHLELLAYLVPQFGWIKWIGITLCVAFTIAMGSVGFLALLAFLVSLEEVGIRLYSRTRSWRITEDVAHAICAHAGIGWVVGAVLMLLMVVGDWALRPFSAWLGTFGFVIAPVCLLAGMLCFETLVFIGMRRCKFANRPRPLATNIPNNPPTDPPVTAA